MVLQRYVATVNTDVDDETELEVPATLSAKVHGRCPACAIISNVQILVRNDKCGVLVSCASMMHEVWACDLHVSLLRPTIE